MERPTRIVKSEVLRDIMERILIAAGCNSENAREATQVFLEADLRGFGLQGLDHLATLVTDLKLGTVKGRARPVIAREGSAYALVNGNWGPGQPAAIFSAEVAVKKAKEAGCCSVGIVDSADIYMIGYYAEFIARNGCVGIVTTTSGPLVHPYGGIERILGTNPIAIAVPTAGEHPVLFDIATSALSASRIRQAAYHGEKVSEGVGIGPDGNPTTDAATIEKGSISPLAGHKGFGLGLCFGLIAGPLVGAAVGKELQGWVGEGGRAGSKGHFMIAIDPASFGDPNTFQNAVSAHLEEIKESKKAEGFSEIRIPGERTFETRARNLGEGITVLEAVWSRTAKIAERLGVPMPE